MGGAGGVSRELRLGILAVAALGAFVFLMLIVGSIGPPRAEIDPLSVEEALAGGSPADEWGSRELHVSGWYAELDADCSGDDGGADASVAWLQRDCPLRVLVPEQPAEDVTQAELLRDGVRLTAPTGAVFPSRAEPSGPNLRMQQLVFIGHFDDPAADGCVPERVERCRNAFVVTDYDELIR
jgi:hypothetical protein